MKHGKLYFIRNLKIGEEYYGVKYTKVHKDHSVRKEPVLIQSSTYNKDLKVYIGSGIGTQSRVEMELSNKIIKPFEAKQYQKYSQSKRNENKKRITKRDPIILKATYLEKYLKESEEKPTKLTKIYTQKHFKTQAEMDRFMKKTKYKYSFEVLMNYDETKNKWNLIKK